MAELILTPEQALRAAEASLQMPEEMHHEVEQRVAATVRGLTAERDTLAVQVKLLREQRDTFAGLAGVDVAELAVAS
jgi:hypothetical protein